MNLKQQAKELYKMVFREDGEDFAVDFTDKFFDNNCKYTLCDGKMVAIVYLLDCNVVCDGKTFPAYYLYAAATHPDHRGKGLMSKLVNEAISEGKTIITKPATEKLFSFYEKFGFEICSYKDEIKKDIKNELKTDEYIKIRKELLETIPHIALLDEDFAIKGLTLYGDKDCIVAVDSESREVKEYINKDENPLNQTKPFAMWKKMDDGLPEKVYFGLAMD